MRLTFSSNASLKSAQSENLHRSHSIETHVQTTSIAAPLQEKELQICFSKASQEAVDVACGTACGLPESPILREN